MDADGRRAMAALLLGALLMAVSLPPWPRDPAACEGPYERAADERTGFTSEVACAGRPASASQQEARSELRGPARLLFGLRLDLNTASQAALLALPAIGPARAEAIVLARRSEPFDSLADLERVPGIGRRTREGLRGFAWVAAEPSFTGEGGEHGRNEDGSWTNR